MTRPDFSRIVARELHGARSGILDALAVVAAVGVVVAAIWLLFID